MVLISQSSLWKSYIFFDFPRTRHVYTDTWYWCISVLKHYDQETQFALTALMVWRCTGRIDSYWYRFEKPTDLTCRRGLWLRCYVNSWIILSWSWKAIASNAFSLFPLCTTFRTHRTSVILSPLHHFPYASYFSYSGAHIQHIAPKLPCSAYHACQSSRQCSTCFGH